MREGDRAPDFSLYDHTRTLRKLSDFAVDGPLVLFFYPIASSPLCSAQACHFRDLGSEFAAVGASRVGISTNAVDRQAHFAQQRSFDFPLLSDVDGRVAERFGVRRGLSRLGSSSESRPNRRAQHTKKRSRFGIFSKIAPVRRTTFVIDTDGTILKTVASELRANIHANQALWYLQNEYRPHR